MNYREETSHYTQAAVAFQDSVEGTLKEHLTSALSMGFTPEEAFHGMLEAATSVVRQHYLHIQLHKLEPDVTTTQIVGEES